MRTYAYGFPRLGKNREFKRLTEAYWKGELSEEELRKGLEQLEDSRLALYQEAVDRYPVGEMTLYDNMLDTAVMVGLYRCGGLGEYYDLCRGKNALQLKKWFNTNYHYLVPDFGFRRPQLKPSWNKPKEEWEKHGKRGIPYLMGPFTFLKLSKGIRPQEFGDYLLALGDIYVELIRDLPEVHIDEPAFAMDVSEEEVELIKRLYGKMASSGSDIYLFTYYDSVDFLEELYELPVRGIGLDLVDGEENLNAIRRLGFPKDKVLIAGIVDGRNVWRTDIREAVRTLEMLARHADEIVISNSCPLYHLPVTVKGENLAKELLGRLSFAEERLYELGLIARACRGEWEEAEKWNTREERPFGVNEEVKRRVAGLGESDFQRKVPYRERAEQQKKRLNLPLFPTHTIGSFPQTPEVRRKRADFRAGRISQEEYTSFIRGEMEKLIKLQTELGLDVFVHGEFERTDMVEFFAQKLDGIATTKRGWVLSYGTRAYRPPIIYGDISRPSQMTLDEISYAQSLTDKPVKGMLTGPVTITAWSFVRKDIPLSQVAYQIALCLRDEVADYERAGIRIVQIDEPAFREKAPIKRRYWEGYFDWAVRSFNLIVSSTKPETQIQTHMCYSEFGEIIEYIAEMDFDVITIEASRSRGDILEHFERVKFERQIGLGVWDIHSPVVPSVEEMRGIVERALRVFPKENFWINPDCGLKTRGWSETKAALKNMVELAHELRKEADGENQN